MSPDKLEMVCNTLMIPTNMKQFGFMLGLTKTGRARPRSGEVIAAFCKYLNNSDRVKIAGWFVGEDAMGNWIKEIRKLAEEAETRRIGCCIAGQRRRVSRRVAVQLLRCLW